MITEATTRTMTYDAENRMATFYDPVVGTSTYVYDGDGRRVRKDSGGLTSIYVYDALGRLAAEYSSAPSFTGPGGTSYISGDHLGSTRLVINPDYSIRGRHDYLPFGEEIEAVKGGRSSIPGYSAIEFRQKFTAKERDNESNLDYFLARYYAGAQGRFVTPDLPANYLTSLPQSWNKYAYALNSPLVIVDPNGRFPQWVHEWIIDQIPGLSPNDRAILKAASADIDSFRNGGQKPSAAFKHAMLNGFDPNSLENDPKKTAEFVESQLRKAIGIQAAYEANHRNQPPHEPLAQMQCMHLGLLYTQLQTVRRFFVFSQWYFCCLVWTCCSFRLGPQLLGVNLLLADRKEG